MKVNFFLCVLVVCVLQWVGSTHGFAPAESVANAVVLTKYNALIHRARVLKQAEVSACAHTQTHTHTHTHSSRTVNVTK